MYFFEKYFFLKYLLIEIVMLRWMLVLVVLTSVFGCDHKCVTIPLVDLLDTTQHDGESYFLYSRTSGWHEKNTIFELYNAVPELDSCNNASIKPLAVLPHDHDKYVKELVFQPQEPYPLRISFTSDISQGYADTLDVRLIKEDP